MMRKLLLLAVFLMSTSVHAAQCTQDRLYTHELDEICLPDVPKRIVVLEYSFVDHLGVLGETPVGIAKDAMPQYLNSIAIDSEVVGTRKSPSLEAIAALRPDLIIGDKKRHASLYKQLSAIAPTLIHNSLRGSYQEQINSLLQIADITHKTELAKKAIADLEEKIEQARVQAHHNNLIIGVFRPGAINAHSHQSFMGSLIARVGKKIPLEARGGQTQYVLDIEGIAAVNPDAIVMMCSKKSQQAFDDLVKHPVFSALKAVKNKHLYVVGKNLWSKGRGVLGLNQIIDNSITSGLLHNTDSQSLTCID